MASSPGRAGSSSGELLRRLTGCYRSLLGGSGPEPSAAEVAGLLLAAVSGGEPGGAPQEAGWERQGFGLSLLRRICCGESEHSLPGASRGRCGGQSPDWGAVLGLLLERMELLPLLVDLFQAEDPLISHLAAQTASGCVLYLLSRSGRVSPVWQQKCVQAFSRCPPGPELDACLCSLCEVLKNLLRQSQQGLLAELVAAFDCSLTALCWRMLPEERSEVTLSGSWGPSVCLLLDLLEVLTAAAGGGSALPSRNVAALPAAVSRCPQGYVRKRVLLLLKRALLLKAGEDWSLEGAGSGDGGAERRQLAQGVLTAAAADGWLQSVQVQPAAFFGGSRPGRDDEAPEMDGGALRAVSLVLLKSVELHLQTAAAGVERTSEVDSYLHRLWAFLGVATSQHGITHPCSWISLLFGEQDDDLMEAARASLSIFLSYRRCSGLEDGSVLEAACASGCNPHCHFVLLLRSLCFDHSLLLDFLISSETCFLEYFVRYLKYLRGDWRGFAAACRHGDGPERGGGLRPGGPGAGRRLVEYDSSDESGDETPPGHRGPAADGNKPASSGTGSGRVCPPAAAAAAQWGEDSCGTLDRAVSCLSELRAVVTRLQTRELFPYNAASLLKLLAQVEASGQRAPPSLCSE